MKPENNKFKPLEVGTISFAHFVHDVYSSFLSPILPLLIEKFSMSYSMAAALTLVQRIPSLFNPLIGIIADKVSIRYLVIAAPSITVISMSLIGVAPVYPVLMILMFMMGIGASLFHVPAPVMVKKVSGKRTGLGMSVFMLGGEAARSVGPLVIVGAVSLWGLEGTYRLIPFGLTASLILYINFRKVKISKEIKKSTDSGALKTLLNYKWFFICVVNIMFFQALLKSSITSFLPTYLSKSSPDLWVGTFALSGFQAAGALGTFTIGALSDKFGRKKFLLIIASVSPFLLIGFILAGKITGLILLLFTGFLIFASQPLIMALVNELKSERPAFLNGVYFTINFVTSAIAVLLAGILADFTGFKTMYVIAACGALISVWFIYKLPVDLNDKTN